MQSRTVGFFFLRCTQHLLELTKAADFLFLEIRPTYSSFPFRSAVKCSTGAIVNAGLMGRRMRGSVGCLDSFLGCVSSCEFAVDMSTYKWWD